MKTETKKLFNAPWGVHHHTENGALYLYCVAKHLAVVGNGFDEVEDEKTANRLALLPDLFDSLDDAQKVLKEVLIEWSNGGDYDTYIAKKRKETGKAPPDYFVEWLELLKNVIEGNDNAR